MGAGVHGSPLEILYRGVAAVLRDRLSVRAKVLLLGWLTVIAGSPKPQASYLPVVRNSQLLILCNCDLWRPRGQDA